MISCQASVSTVNATVIRPLECLDCHRVLIPRPETEAYTLYLASILSHSQPPTHSLSILDLCTGTGCIPLLLLHSLLTYPSTRDIPIHIHGPRA
ncbi:hypothetical protein VTI28DRAFT_9269 [Corynascus sepedonium]